VKPNSVGAHGSDSRRGNVSKLALAALGVVYGDIGTSPLYTIQECFRHGSGIAHEAESVYGLLSLVFWAITLVVVLKYLTFVLRADNEGDGGLMALIALVQPHVNRANDREHLPAPVIRTLVALGLFATALLFCDGMITPAVSVLGAVEGLAVATHVLEPWIVPISCVILLGVFLVQSIGTGDIARVFGPVMLVWFVTIAVLGVPAIARHPEVLAAVNPLHAVRFAMNEGRDAFFALGSVILCITGAEALYADMGHFGRAPIRLAWYVVAFPALLLNYFGQGALILAEGEAALANPFYRLAPEWFVIPLVAIATAAAIIASQALISGAFSMAQQAVRLGYLPRLRIEHTSSQMRGQVYVPVVNVILMIGCFGFVLGFRSVTGLAGAYGVAVMGAMVTTTLLVYVVARRRWKWGVASAATLTALFLAVETPFLAASLAKIFDGAWVPLVLGVVLFIVMDTWKKGRDTYLLRGPSFPMDAFLDDLRRQEVTRVEGTGVFLSARGEGVPHVLLHFYRHCRVLHKRVVLLTFEVLSTPRAKLGERVEVTQLGQGLHRVVARYGFMETLTAPRVLELCRDAGLELDATQVSWFLGRETIVVTERKSLLSTWRKSLFELLSRNASSATHYFDVPPNRVVELGARIEV
jgi:KUP system potassium uptake protein